MKSIITNHTSLSTSNKLDYKYKNKNITTSNKCHNLASRPIIKQWVRTWMSPWN